MKPVEAQIEAFLAEIGATLAALPEERRQEILLETRGHLEAMIAARRADGMDEVRAWESTRRSFGDAAQIGGALATEWKRAPRFETVGRPLTTAEKLENITSGSGNALLFGLTFVMLKPWLVANHLVFVFLIAEMIRSAAFRVWRVHKSGEILKTSTVFNLLLPLLLVGGLAVLSQFSNLIPSNNFKEWFVPSIIAFCIAISIWLKKQEKDVRPWRTLSLFATNPMGAEEMYRLMNKVGVLYGALTGLLLGLLLSLSTGEKFLVLKFLPWIGVILVARVIYRRWVARRAF